MNPRCNTLIKIFNLLDDLKLEFPIHRVVDWLDEYHSGSFRQAQVSFSTRIPAAFPLGDATTMSNNVSLYHTSGSLLQLAFRDVVKTASALPTTPSKSPTIIVNGKGLFHVIHSFFFMNGIVKIWIILCLMLCHTLSVRLLTS